MNLRTLTTLLALTLLGTAAWAAPLPQGTRGPKTTEFKGRQEGGHHVVRVPPEGRGFAS